MKTLQSVLLRLVSRNVQTLVNFMVALDAKLDAFLVAHDAEVAGYEQDIRAAQQKIEDALHGAQVVRNIKNALTKR